MKPPRPAPSCPARTRTLAAAWPLLAAAVSVEIGAGFGLLIGFRTRVMALMLFVFTLVVNFVMHDFWTISAAETARIEMQLFAKNIAIAGGLVCSQALTLYTTPVIYLALDRLRWRFTRRKPPRAAAFGLEEK